MIISCTRPKTLAALATCCLALTMLAASTLQAKERAMDRYHVYIGTYTGGKSEGIYLFELNTRNGLLKSKGLAAKSTNPSFLAIHPNGQRIYAVNEVGDFKGEKAGAISAFQLEPKSGALKFLNQQSSRGGAPCHLVVDKTGKNVLVANYTGGSVASLPIDKDGKLGEASSFIQHTGSSVDPRRQKAPHGHSINLDAGNRFAFAADLGLDKMLIYKFDPKAGKLTANDPAFAKVEPGSGPRHFAFHPSGKYAYVINEMTLTATAFRYDSKRGELKPMQTISTLPEVASRRGMSTAEVQVSPNGRFLYGSNRGHDTIAIFSIDQKTGILTVVGHQSTGGRTPRNFGIDPTGSYLLAANQSTDTVVVFRMDQKTGKLSRTAQAPVPVPSPVCVKFLPIP